MSALMNKLEDKQNRTSWHFIRNAHNKERRTLSTTEQEEASKLKPSSYKQISSFNTSICS